MLLHPSQVYNLVTIHQAGHCTDPVLGLDGTIDQTNKVEKLIQIPLMEDIINYAQPTYIWLGNGSDSTDRAMHCLKLAWHLRIPPAAVPGFTKVPPVPQLRTFSSETSSAPYGSKSLRAILSTLLIAYSIQSCRFAFSESLRDASVLTTSVISLKLGKTYGLAHIYTRPRFQKEDQRP